MVPEKYAISCLTKVWFLDVSFGGYLVLGDLFQLGECNFTILPLSLSHDYSMTIPLLSHDHPTVIPLSYHLSIIPVVSHYHPLIVPCLSPILLSSKNHSICIPLSSHDYPVNGLVLLGTLKPEKPVGFW